MENNIILSSRIRLARDLNQYPFPAKQKELSAKKVLSDVFCAISSNFEFECIKLSEYDEDKIALLMENNIISKDIDLAYGGVAISSDETVSIMVNEEDHIRMQCVLSGLNLKKAYDIINDIDTELGKNLKFAYDTEFGFLTACPSNIGTGIRASVMLFLPALSVSGKLAELVDTLKNIGITIRGTFGEGSGASGYIYQISNEVTLGKSEKQIIQEVESAVLRIVSMEEEALSKIKESNDIQLFDTIKRAFGTLYSSYILSTKEFLELAALTKFGYELGLIHLKNSDVLDELIYEVKPANLLKLAGSYLSDTERDLFRAKYVSDRLKFEQEN